MSSKAKTDDDLEARPASSTMASNGGSMSSLTEKAVPAAANPVADLWNNKRTRVYLLISSIVLILIIVIPAAVLSTASSSSSTPAEPTIAANVDPSSLTGPPLRILPLGDSLTYGVGTLSRTSYRLHLQQLLLSNSTAHTFVGRASSGGDHMSNPEHEGYERVLIYDLLSKVRTHLAPLRPDIVLLHVGSNDCVNTYKTSEMPARYRELLDAVVGELPGVPVLVGTLMKVWTAPSQRCFNRFNEELRALVAEVREEGNRVEIVEMGEVGDAGMGDWLHPDDNGYKAMAEAWFEGIADAKRRGWVTLVDGSDG